MSGSLSIPFTFGAASGNVPASQLDANWAALVNYINPREVTVGVIGSRPAFGTAGRWYLATDVNGGTLYVDSGTAWVQAASGVTAVGGTLAVSGGGTGQVTLVSGSYLKGNGTSPVTQQSTPLPVADLGSGSPSASNFLRGDGTWAVPSVGSFTPSFTSAATGFAFSSVVTIPHGLAGRPVLTTVMLRNTTIDGGWQVNDEIPVLGTISEQNASGHSIAWGVDATNVTVTIAAQWTPFNKTTGAAFNLTAASWAIVARCWI